MIRSNAAINNNPHTYHSSLSSPSLKLSSCLPCSRYVVLPTEKIVAGWLVVVWFRSSLLCASPSSGATTASTLIILWFTTSILSVALDLPDKIDCFTRWIGTAFIVPILFQLAYCRLVTSNNRKKEECGVHKGDHHHDKKEPHMIPYPNNTNKS